MSLQEFGERCPGNRDIAGDIDLTLAAPAELRRRIGGVIDERTRRESLCERAKVRTVVDPVVADLVVVIVVGARLRVCGVRRSRARRVSGACASALEKKR